MDVHTLVSQLGDRAGTPLALNEDGILTLMFENDVEVTMEYDNELNVLQLYAVIGGDPLDDDIRLTLYGTLLEANMVAGGISGGTLALDDESGELLLTREIDLSVVDLDHLANATEAMAETAAQWRDILDTPLQGVGEAEHSETDALA
ncbi:type III secretion system chaperone [Achromobacter xylosoxidans]